MLLIPTGVLRSTAGANAGTAFAVDDTSIGATTDDVAAPDGRNPGLAEPAGVGAPAKLSSVGNWGITTTDPVGNKVAFGAEPDAAAQESVAASGGSW